MALMVPVGTIKIVTFKWLRHVVGMRHVDASHFPKFLYVFPKACTVPAPDRIGRPHFLAGPAALLRPALSSSWTALIALIKAR